MPGTELQGSDSVQIPSADVVMPRLGFGVYKIRGDGCHEACLTALRYGYRHIDSAQLYRNEDEVGRAVAESSVKRQDVFLTTKISRAHPSSIQKTYGNALESIRKLDGPDGYVDLFLIHMPGRDKANRERLWKALEQLHAEGKARAIGVSNFHIHHLEEMKEYASIWPPHVNQIEVGEASWSRFCLCKLDNNLLHQLHPWCQQRNLDSYCKDNKILVQAYCPLVAGSKFQDPTLCALAARRGKTPAQILIRYSLEKGWVPLPKSEKPNRIRENAAVFDFALGTDDVTILDGLDQGSEGACFPANSS
ncbi:hypothetical protein S40285_01181 [Stachybotrys chlorohalonatus IBT 40285]|uniref:NADP-dependent oxidoreductase domain-containing protein n=1 Tax=Stachybotrys chlorohalonatus (strain IBT 40285) TaxID=1283841 RepID=A0A084QXZ4_STAC4|nr:hypothetical protein S40285_01181 [Stachybotrys chlorohalonata IBT 40285]